MANELINEQASERLPIGLLAAGPSPGNDLPPGTTDGCGSVVPAPADSGAGAGAYVESLLTVVGGATSGGNC